MAKQKKKKSVKLESCIQKVKKSGKSVNPFAVCQASVGKSKKGKSKKK